VASIVPWWKERALVGRKGERGLYGEKQHQLLLLRGRGEKKREKGQALSVFGDFLDYLLFRARTAPGRRGMSTNSVEKRKKGEERKALLRPPRTPKTVLIVHNKERGTRLLRGRGSPLHF